MKRRDLEHLIRAAGAVAQVSELYILGSQAILGAFPGPPDELLVSMEVDTYPVGEPEKADLIDGSIGELSPFHEQFGYYAHGVGPETARLPERWQKRLISVSNDNTGGITGLCLHPADLAISKLIAGREKDITYVSALLRHGLVSEEGLHDLLPELPAADGERVTSMLHACRARNESRDS